ncbi:hypothetical protein D3C76_1418600 [compost metagenome]
MVKVVHIHDVILNRLLDALWHHEMMGIPFGILAAEFTHFSGEAFAVQVRVLTQNLQIAAFNNFFSQMNNFIQHMIPSCIRLIKQCHNKVPLSTY